MSASTMPVAAVPVLMSPIDAFSEPCVCVSLCHKLLLLPASFAMCQAASTPTIALTPVAITMLALNSLECNTPP